MSSSNEIIKAFECCIKDDCDNCPSSFGNCMDNNMRAAIDLINRYEAEIKRLADENKKQKAIIEDIENSINPLPFVTDFDMAMNKTKDDAVKEFAQRLKKRSGYFYKNGGHIAWECVTVYDINIISKELVGE